MVREISEPIIQDIIKWVTKSVLDRICWGINNDFAFFARSFIDWGSNRNVWLWLFAQAVSNQVILRRVPPSAGYAATSNPQLWPRIGLSATECRLCSVSNPRLSPVPPQPNAQACCSQREAALLCPLHHCPATAVQQRQTHGAACPPPATDDGA